MKNQTGFTLIELVMVIVILGILAAVALPKFVNLSGDARMASANAAGGALSTAATMAHSAFLVRNTADAGTVTMEGVTATNNNGYPLASEMAGLAGIVSANYIISVAGTTLTVTPIGAPVSTCSATYTEPVSAGLPPVIATTPNPLLRSGC